jgi:hypothetical protein
MPPPPIKGVLDASIIMSNCPALREMYWPKSCEKLADRRADGFTGVRLRLAQEVLEFCKQLFDRI